jgi:hypothetical protein
VLWVGINKMNLVLLVEEIASEMDGSGSFGTAALLIREDEHLTQLNYLTELLNAVKQLYLNDVKLDSS